MTRPSTVKPDNFFLLLFRSLRQRRIPIVLGVVSHSLVLVALALLIFSLIVGIQFKSAMQDQADAVGESLVQQTAMSAREPLVSNDMLSLNVLLTGLTKNPLVAHVAIYSADNRILAEAGSRPKRSLMDLASGLYSTRIEVQDMTAGQVRISLDMEKLRQPMMFSLRSMALIGLVLLVLTLSLSLRLGRQISLPLMQLRAWLNDPTDPAPGVHLHNEVGDLSRRLQERLVPPKPEDAEISIDFDDTLMQVATENPIETTKEPFIEDSLDALNDGPDTMAEPPSPAFEDAADPIPEQATPTARIAILAIRLGDQEQLRRLPRSRLIELLEHYRDGLEGSARQYNGCLQTLDDGTSLILFQESEEEAFLLHALCCGELMRALCHALQLDLADTGISLLLHFGMALTHRSLSPDDPNAILDDPAVQTALTLSQSSRNLLLLSEDIVENESVSQNALIRTVTTAENAWCVEQLKEPHLSQLEDRLFRLRLASRTQV